MNKEKSKPFKKTKIILISFITLYFAGNITIGTLVLTGFDIPKQLIFHYAMIPLYASSGIVYTIRKMLCKKRGD